MKIALNKCIFLFICVLAGLWLGESSACADLKIKIVVQPFANHSAYQGSLEIEKFFSKLVRDELKASQIFQIVRYDVGDVKQSSGSDSTSPKFSGQAAIEGKILKFVPNAVVPDPKNPSEEAFAESAEFKVELKIFHSRNGRLISREVLEAVNSDGDIFFAAADGHPGVIMKTSIGKAMVEAARKTLTVIQPLVDKITFETRVLSVDMEENMVRISAGTDDGIGLLDVFRIYEIDSKMEDPWSGEPLGEIQIPLGAVKIKRVFEKVSEGYIVAGDKFKPGNLARLKWNNYVRGSGKIISGKRRALPWWDFYGGFALNK